MENWLIQTPTEQSLFLLQLLLSLPGHWYIQQVVCHETFALPHASYATSPGTMVFKVGLHH